jgi:hypothetical protein
MATPLSLAQWRVRADYGGAMLGVKENPRL